MIRCKSIKEKLKINKPVIGGWITIGHPVIADVLGTSDFDFICIDLEHSNIDDQEMQQLIITIQSNNKAALVRVQKNEDYLIKKALDAGADGVIVPMINSKADVEKAVNSIYYPPIGRRGVGLHRANAYSKAFNDYYKNQPNNILFIIQIEHIDGINNLNEILGNKMIDATMIGPYDLSGSLNIPGEFENKKLLNVLMDYENISSEQGISKGYHIVEPDYKLILDKIKKGYSFLVFGVDFLFMMRKVDEELKKLKDFNNEQNL